jgi:hypothetical protein
MISLAVLPGAKLLWFRPEDAGQSDNTPAVRGIDPALIRS